MALPIAINVPNVPAPCTMDLVVCPTSSMPLSPALLFKSTKQLHMWSGGHDRRRSCTNLREENPPKRAPAPTPTKAPIMKPSLTLSKTGDLLAGSGYWGRDGHGDDWDEAAVVRRTAAGDGQSMVGIVSSVSPCPSLGNRLSAD